MKKDNCKQMNRAPQDIVREPLISLEEMLDYLTEGAIELYALGFIEDLSQPDVFRNAMQPLAIVWGDEDGLVEKAMATVHEKCIALGDSGISAVDSKVFGRERILAIFITLTDTIVWLDSREDRLRIAELIYFLKDFWDIEGSLA